MRTIVAFDLDDTLYKEWRFVVSASRVISKYVAGMEWHGLYREMASAVLHGGGHYECLENWLLRHGRDPVVEMPGLVNLCRNHKPELHLPPASVSILEYLTSRDAVIAIITDGRSSTQRNKMSALGIGRYVDNTDIYISGETGYDKSSGRPFIDLMRKYNKGRFFYIGDNPSKDFVWPNRLGWTTVCLLSGGYNIHAQQPSTAAEAARFSIKSLRDLPQIIYPE